MHLNVLTYLMVYLTAMVLVVPLSKRFGLGAVPGYLLAGLAIGPSGFALTQNTADIELLAELGVVLMLFTIGLELDAKKLWAMRRLVFVFGALQLLMCTAGTGIALYVFGFSWALAVLVGITLSLSSTAVALQLMKDRNLMNSSSGQAVFGVLLFQDMAAIPLLIGISLLAPSPDAVSFHWLSALGAIVLLIVLGRYLVGYMLHWVASYGSRELFVGFALLLVIATMELMTLVGVSAGLGAFLAGILLASSEFRHQLEVDLEPFKGLFLGLFFVTIGSGIDLTLFITHWQQILQLLVLFMVAKLALLWLVAAIQGLAAPERLSYAVLLGQGSEFAFVIGSLATAGALLSEEQGAFLALVIALSVAVSPVLMVVNDRVQRLFARSRNNTEPTVTEITAGPVIIAGFGRYGQIISRLLLANGITPTIMDHDSDTIQNMRRFGFKVYYGDARRLELLEAAGAAQAKVLVIAVDNREAITAIAQMARTHFPELTVMARARDASHIYELRRLGVEHIQRELFESSLRQGRDILHVLGFGQYEARELAERFRAANYELLAKMEQLHSQSDEQSYMQQLKQSRQELQHQLEQEVQQAVEMRRQHTD